VVVWFGFEGLKLNRIYARHLVSNTASAPVLSRFSLFTLAGAEANQAPGDPGWGGW